MKRPYYLIFVISAFILAGMFMLVENRVFAKQDGLTLIIVSTLVLVGLIFITLRIIALKNKEPLEDEYSKKVMEKSASYAFYISLYLWLLISYFSEESQMETQSIIGLGIVGMALVFVLSWVLVKFTGFRNEQ